MLMDMLNKPHSFTERQVAEARFNMRQGAELERITTRLLDGLPAQGAQRVAQFLAVQDELTRLWSEAKRARSGMTRPVRRIVLRG